LQDKCVSCPTQCASCDSDFEDLNQLLFECPFSIQVWQSAGIWFDIQNSAIHTDSAVNSIFYLLENLPPNIQQRVGTICWRLWKHRNLKIWEDVTENSAQVVDRARQLLEEWQDANPPRRTVGVRNMISNEGMRENLKIISIDDKSEYYNDNRCLLMRWLHYIYYYINNAN